jgi:hypothetical protein
LTSRKAEGYTAGNMENEPRELHTHTNESHELHTHTQPRDRTPVSFPGVPKPKKKNVGVKIAILVVLLLLIGGVAWYLLSSDNPFSSSAITPTPTAAVVNEMPTEAPSPTPMTVSKDQLKVQVLNGTGIPGEAGLLQKAMQDLGFTSIDTGNADTKDYTKTEVSYSSNVSDDVRAEVSAKLQSMYTTVMVSDVVPSGVDIKVITGTRTGAASIKTPTPTVKGTSTSSTGTKTPTPSIKTTGTGTPIPTGSGTGTPTPTPKTT